MKLYEGMFIIDNTIANADWDAAAKQVSDILENRGAEVVNNEKWEERRLAYKLKGHKRGTYLLIYFKAPPDSITPIKRDLQLSDNVLRSLIVKIDKIKEPVAEAESPEKEPVTKEAESPEKEPVAPVASE